MSEFTYARISVTGADAFEFLQAQLTADLNALRGDDELTPIRSAWCNAKGRVVCIATVSKVENGFELSLPADLVDLVMQRLALFRFRSKVEFAVLPGHSIDAATAARKIRDGVPEIGLAQSEKFTAHMLNLDLLGIVSLDKGCYPGQEIVARTHYRGVSKRRCMRFKGNIPAAPGDKISDSNREIGEVVNSIGNELLAVVPVASAKSVLAIGTDRLTPLDLPYAL